MPLAEELDEDEPEEFDEREVVAAAGAGALVVTAGRGPPLEFEPLTFEPLPFEPLLMLGALPGPELLVTVAGPRLVLSSTDGPRLLLSSTEGPRLLLSSEPRPWPRSSPG